MRYFGYFFGKKNFIYSTLLLVLSFGFAYYGCLAGMGLLRLHFNFFWRFLNFDASDSFAPQFLLLCFLLFVLSERSEKNYLNVSFQWKDFRDSLILFLAGYPGVCFLAASAYLFFSYFVKNVHPLETSQGLHSVTNLLSGMSLPTAVVILALNAVFEESIIRAFFMNQLSGYIRQGWLVIVLSAILQAGYHIYQGWFRVLMILFLFLVFSYYYQKFKRTTPLVLAHFYVDLFSFILLKLITKLGYGL